MAVTDCVAVSEPLPDVELVELGVSVPVLLGVIVGEAVKDGVPVLSAVPPPEPLTVIVRVCVPVAVREFVALGVAVADEVSLTLTDALGVAAALIVCVPALLCDGDAVPLRVKVPLPVPDELAPSDKDAVGVCVGDNVPVAVLLPEK